MARYEVDPSEPKFIEVVFAGQDRITTCEITSNQEISRVWVDDMDISLSTTEAYVFGSNIVLPGYSDVQVTVLDFFALLDCLIIIQFQS